MRRYSVGGTARWRELYLHRRISCLQRSRSAAFEIVDEIANPSDRRRLRRMELRRRVAVLAPPS